MNNSSTIENLTISEIPSDTTEPGYVTASKTVAYVFAMVIALVGNSLIIACYIRTRTAKHLHRTVNDCLILSLAFSDLLLPVFAVPERITRIYTNDQWVMMGTIGVIMCKLVNFNEAVSIVASLLTLDAIAIDRYSAVMFPFKKTLTISGIKWLLFSIWGIAVAYNSPLLYFSTLVEEADKEVVCNARTSTWNVQSWRLFYLGLSSVSLLIIFCCYAAIAVRMSTRKKSLRKLSISGRQREITSRKVLKTSSAIIVAFYLCYFNYWFYALRCSDSKSSPDICRQGAFKFLSVYFVMLNSALNPVIYFVYSSRYRRGLYRLFTVR